MTAVENLLMKKKIGERIRILLALSSFNTNELKFYLASLIFINGYLLHTRILKIVGMITDATMMNTDAIFAIFLPYVSTSSPCVSFITAKNVRS